MPPADFEGACVEASLFPLASGGAITAAVNTAHIYMNCANVPNACHGCVGEVDTDPRRSTSFVCYLTGDPTANAKISADQTYTRQ